VLLLNTDPLSPSRKKSTTEKRAGKRERAKVELTMFIWRMNVWALSDIMQNVLRFCDDKQVWHNNSPSASVAKIFTEKANLNPFIDLVISILDEDRKYLMSNIVALVEKVRPIFEQRWGKDQTKIAPMEEVTAYSNMIACASYDWRQLKTAAGVLIKDDTVGHKLFYRYLNKVSELARANQISIDRAFRDTHERSVLTMEVNYTSQYDGDKMWLDSLSNDFDFTEYCKNKVIVEKAAKLAREKSSVLEKTSTTTTGLVMGQGGGGCGVAKKAYSNPFLPAINNNNNARAQRRGTISGWLSYCMANLNKKHLQVFGKGSKYCAAYHNEHMVCSGTDPRSFKCVRGQYKRLHTCVCGVNGHPMSNCKQIW